jgi:hypothetical protein
MLASRSKTVAFVDEDVSVDAGIHPYLYTKTGTFIRSQDDRVWHLSRKRLWSWPVIKTSLCL